MLVIASLVSVSRITLNLLVLAHDLLSMAIVEGACDDRDKADVHRGAQWLHKKRRADVVPLKTMQAGLLLLLCSSSALARDSRWERTLLAGSNATVAQAPAAPEVSSGPLVGIFVSRHADISHATHSALPHIAEKAQALAVSCRPLLENSCSCAEAWHT